MHNRANSYKVHAGRTRPCCPLVSGSGIRRSNIRGSSQHPLCRALMVRALKLTPQLEMRGWHDRVSCYLMTRARLRTSSPALVGPSESLVRVQNVIASIVAKLGFLCVNEEQMFHIIYIFPTKFPRGFYCRLFCIIRKNTRKNSIPYYQNCKSPEKNFSFSLTDCFDAFLYIYVWTLCMSGERGSRLIKKRRT